MLYAPEQISGFVLEELRNAAQKHFRGLEVSNVVITVPAYFNDDQRQVRPRYWILQTM
jgi:molecular chaperone DnaK (HSP70)